MKAFSLFLIYSFKTNHETFHSLMKSNHIEEQLYFQAFIINDT
jgi:hypothetical protein